MSFFSPDESEVLADAGTCTSGGVPPPGNHPLNETLCLLGRGGLADKTRARARIQKFCAPILVLPLAYGEVL